MAQASIKNLSIDSELSIISGIEQHKQENTINKALEFEQNRGKNHNFRQRHSISDLEAFMQVWVQIESSRIQMSRCFTKPPYLHLQG